MTKTILTSWQRLIGLLKLDRKDIKQVFYYAIFAGLVNLSLPLGIQAIINLIQGAQISSSWIVLGDTCYPRCGFCRCIATHANANH